MINFLPLPVLGVADSNDLAIVSSVIASTALVISGISLWVSWLRLQLSTRPYVTASVVMAKGGNASIAFRLQITNTGPAPALDIQMHVEKDVLDEALLPGSNPKIADPIRRIFETDSFIPVLVSGELTRAGFGLTGIDDPTWKYGQTIPVQVTYRSLAGTRYKDGFNLVIKNASVFAGHDWSDDPDVVG